MFKKPLGLLGIFLVVVGIGYFIGAGVAYSKVQGGYGSLQAFSEAQDVQLSYNDEGLIPASRIEEILREHGEADSYRWLDRGYRRYRSDADGPDRTYSGDRVRERLHYVRRP